MTRSQRVLDKLAEIEAELRRIGYWDEGLNAEEVREEALRIAREEGASPIGRMSFEQWPQAVFLHNARQSAQADTLPARSQVGVMAMRQYDYHSYMPEAQTLCRLLSEFDALVEGKK